MKMKVKVWLIGFALATGGMVAFSDTARVGVQVLDDVTGAPVPNVKIVATFRDNNGWRAWTQSAPVDIDSAETDEKGQCRVSGKTNCGSAGFFLKSVPEGYYASPGWGHRFKTKNIVGLWQPDDMVATIRLQRVEHPIPLAVKRIGDHINASKVGDFNGTNMVWSFDFVMGDYLPPYGQGKVADLVFKSSLVDVESTNNFRRVLKFFDFANEASFPGKGNGILSQMPRPTAGIKLREAPGAGYEPSTILHCGLRKKLVGPNLYQESYSDSDENRCYYFRIRSEYDDKGVLIGGYYGKIYEDFKLGFRLETGCSVEFVYYLNPTPLDRNLEWDMKNNLCPTAGKHESQQP